MCQTSPTEAPRRLESAENLLVAGSPAPAYAAAASVLAAEPAGASTPAVCVNSQRALYVMLQAKYQEGELANLSGIAGDMKIALSELPAPVVLLWGVIALQLNQAQAAADTVGAFIDGVTANSPTTSAPAGSLAAEDRLALARLYGVRILAASLQQGALAADWLQRNPLALPPEQRGQLVEQVQRQGVASPPFSSTDSLARAGSASLQRCGSSTISSTQPAAPAGCNEAGTCRPADSPYFTMTGDMGPDESSPLSPLARVASVASSTGGMPTTPGSSTQRLARYGTDVGAAPAPAGGLWESACSKLGRAGDAGCSLLASAREQLDARGITPSHLLFGTAAGAVLLYAAYAERRCIRRRSRGGAAAVVSGLMDAVEMALGWRPNPVGLAPNL